MKLDADDYIMWLFIMVTVTVIGILTYFKYYPQSCG